jgi:hypothetical protein
MQIIDLGQVVTRPPSKDLFINVAPAGAVRTIKDLVDEPLWVEIREAVRNRALCACEVCGAAEDRHFTCSVWGFEDSVQRLLRMEYLCESCFLTRRMDIAEYLEVVPGVLKHWASIRGWSEDEARQQMMEFIKAQAALQDRQWVLDLSWLTENLSCVVGLDTIERMLYTYKARKGGVLWREK